MEETDVLLECGYCKNKSELIVRKRYVQTLKDEYENQHMIIWRILECPVCSKLNLSENYVMSLSEEYKWESGADNTEYGQEIIYPVPKNENNLQLLPREVNEAYRAALKVKNVPNAFAAYIGRTLEVVCKQENAKGYNLKAKIDYLVETNRIPSILAEMAHQLRLFRNVGIHADDPNKVNTEDVAIVEEFVDTILEYLYVAPAKIKNLQERHERERKEREEHENWLLNLPDHPF